MRSQPALKTSAIYEDTLKNKGMHESLPLLLIACHLGGDTCKL